MRTIKKTALAAMAAFTALTLTACDGSSDDGKKSGAAKADNMKSEKLKAGQPASEEQELGTDKQTGKFTVTGQRVVMGKPEDLKGDKEDAKKYAGKTVAYVYLSAKLSGGDAPMKPPMLITNVSALTEGGVPATRLMVIGNLPGTPSDCAGQDFDKVWKKDEERTFCQPVVIPQSSKVTHITFQRGYYKEPLKWALDK
ncbi:hypothetical protein GCM10020221_23790 [Streptomyces thioluteus]|uniref:Lipoprotein n=1 Tax=Streptomyces thioluteus TaxID=66431 RepID=A0ABP6JBV4_STRTU